MYSASHSTEVKQVVIFEYLRDVISLGTPSLRSNLAPDHLLGYATLQ
jgi:hypothetical protein